MNGGTSTSNGSAAPPGSSRPGPSSDSSAPTTPSSSSSSSAANGKPRSQNTPAAENSIASQSYEDAEEATFWKTPAASSNAIEDASGRIRHSADAPTSTGSTIAGQHSISSASTPTHTPRPVRKRRLPNGDTPKSILKAAPPPPKAFSFRRDILQSLNSRLAQQGVNVQVPVPQGGTAQGAANLIGGMFKRIGGMAGAAGAAFAGPQPATGSFPSPPNSASSASGSSVNSAPSLATASLQGIASRIQGATQAAQTYAQAPASPASSSTSTLLDVSSTPPAGGSVSQTSGLPAPTDSAAPLKRVQFTVSKMSVIYPISGAIAPEDEDDTRRRIEKLHRQALRERKQKEWTPQELEALYRECCRTREEHPLKKMRLIFEEAAKMNPPALRTLDLSFLPLDRQAVDPIADLLSVDFGLSKLVLENCGLTDDALKAILHALLISGTLPNLSLASNRKIRYHGWRYVAIFMRRARALKYLDLSENSLNKAALEHIVEAIRKSPEAIAKAADQAKQSAEKAKIEPVAAGELESTRLSEDLDEDGEPLMPPAPLLRQVADEDKVPLTSAIISLRLENCGLKVGLISLLASAVRFSELKHLSLRRNRINPMGAVALAIMLKDYPDSESSLDGMSIQSNGEQSTGASQVPQTPSSDVARQGRSNTPSSAGVVPRSYSPVLPDIPMISSSPGGGMTVRRLPVPDYNPRRSRTAPMDTDVGQTSSQTTVAAADIDAQLTPAEEAEVRASQQAGQTEEEALALYQAKRAKRILGSMPRVGNLLTLDLKSNDLRGGVAYLAQVLRKNRTLRVLNLSDNGIDMAGLIAVAEALKYNSTLETLDMSHNPCSGPGVEGITTLRTAFALNSHLKRLFLNDTDLSSNGAIALAEFLPEARSLIHLDLTENFAIDIAGVMALAVSVKMNKSLRCLDLNIPPNDPDFARLSQDILQSCIRNTQIAQRKADQRGIKQPVAAPIYKSVVARAAKEKDERQKAIEATKAAARDGQQKLVDSAEACIKVLQELLQGEEKRRKEAKEASDASAPPSQTTTTASDDFVRDLVTQSQKLQSKLTSVIGGMEEGELLQRSLKANDSLEEITSRLVKFYQSAFTPRPKAQPRVASPRRQPSLLSPTEATPTLQSHFGSPSLGGSKGDEDGFDDDMENGQDARELNPEDVPSEALSGLRLSHGAQDGDEAVYDEPENLAEKEESIPAPPSSSISDSSGLAQKGESVAKERKARHMVDEEGEIFRRARTLQVGEEDDEENVGGEQRPSAKADGQGSTSETTVIDGASSGQGASSAKGGLLRTTFSSSSEPDGASLSPSTTRATSTSTSNLTAGGSPRGGKPPTPLLSPTLSSATSSPLAGVVQDGDLPGEELKRMLLQADVPALSPKREKDKELLGGGLGG